MPSLRNIFRYMGHYGIKSTVGLIREKLLVDPKRFSPDKRRTLPHFPERAKGSVLPLAHIPATDRHILYLVHYFYPKKKGGTERFTLSLAKEMLSLGNRATVLVLEANEPKDLYPERHGNILFRTYQYDGVDCIGFRHIKAPLGLYYKDVRVDDLELRAFARHIIEKYGVDLVHATYPQPFAPFLAECSVLRVPYVVTCTDFCMMCHYATMVDDRGDFCRGTECGEKCARVCKTYGCADFKARRRHAIEVLTGAHAVTVPSEFVARVMSCEYPEISFHPVAHGISDAFSYRARVGAPRRFVYAGTLTALKGVHMLLDALAELPSPDISLHIYGEGDPSYVDALKAKGDPRVKFHGAVPGDQMPEIYHGADCVIVPSMWYETYNFVLREAIATGALGVAADIGAMPEAVDEGKNGYLFAPSDKASLVRALKAALAFDFKNYTPRTYPTPKAEGELYARIYMAALQNSTPTP